MIERLGTKFGAEVVRTLADIAETAAGIHKEYIHLDWDNVCLYFQRGIYFTQVARDLRSMTLCYQSFGAMPALEKEYFRKLLDEQQDLFEKIFELEEKDMGADDQSARLFVQEPSDLQQGQKTLGLMVLEHLREQGLVRKVKDEVASSEWTTHEVTYLLRLFEGSVTALEQWGEGAIPKSVIKRAGTHCKAQGLSAIGSTAIGSTAIGSTAIGIRHSSC